MGRYAEDTKVPVTRSILHIEKELKRYGADGFMHGYDGNDAKLSFKWNGRVVLMRLVLPEDEKGRRQRYRTLLLSVKSRLACIECGVETFEEAFMAHLVLPDGSTLGDRWAGEYKALVDGGGKLPKMIGFNG
jgi:hypothetical protein